MPNPRTGDTLNSLLEESGIADEVREMTEKRVFALQLLDAMKAAKVTKSELARRMETSRAVIDRMLDFRNPSLTLQTMTKAAAALNRRITISMHEAVVSKKRPAKRKVASRARAKRDSASPVGT